MACKVLNIMPPNIGKVFTEDGEEPGLELIEQTLNAVQDQTSTEMLIEVPGLTAFMETGPHSQLHLIRQLATLGKTRADTPSRGTAVAVIVARAHFEKKQDAAQSIAGWFGQEGKTHLLVAMGTIP